MRAEFWTTPAPAHGDLRHFVNIRPTTTTPGSFESSFQGASTDAGLVSRDGVTGWQLQTDFNTSKSKILKSMRIHYQQQSTSTASVGQFRPFKGLGKAICVTLSGRTGLVPIGWVFVALLQVDFDRLRQRGNEKVMIKADLLLLNEWVLGWQRYDPPCSGLTIAVK